MGFEVLNQRIEVGNTGGPVGAFAEDAEAVAAVDEKIAGRHANPIRGSDAASVELD